MEVSIWSEFCKGFSEGRYARRRRFIYASERAESHGQHAERQIAQSVWNMTEEEMLQAARGESPVLPPYNKDIEAIVAKARALNEEWDTPARGGDFNPPYSATGRTRAFAPELQSLPFGRRGTADVQFNFEFAELERRIAMGLFDMFTFSTQRKMETAALENSALSEWAGGENPRLKVRLVEEGRHLHARYGKYGIYCLGEDTERLERMGYRFEVQHRRDYYDYGTEEIKRLRPAQVPFEVSAGRVYFYKDAPKLEELSTDPLAEGGDSTVTVYAPSGHWASGVALCAPDDGFDKGVGRTIALGRALSNLNEVVNGY